MESNQPPPLRLEDIDTIPAARLLELSYQELNALISEAEVVTQRSRTRADWLRGLKIEKSLRNRGPWNGEDA